MNLNAKLTVTTIVLVPLLLGAAIGALGLASLRDARAGDHKSPECVAAMDANAGVNAPMSKRISSSAEAMGQLDAKGALRGVVLVQGGVVLCAWYE